jgi:hypothetical protein
VWVAIVPIGPNVVQVAVLSHAVVRSVREHDCSSVCTYGVMDSVHMFAHVGSSEIHRWHFNPVIPVPGIEFSPITDANSDVRINNSTFRTPEFRPLLSIIHRVYTE